MTTKNAAQGEPSPTKNSVHMDSLDGIVRAGGFVTARTVATIHRSKEGRDNDLIKSYWSDEQIFNHLWARITKVSNGIMRMDTFFVAYIEIEVRDSRIFLED